MAAAVMMKKQSSFDTSNEYESDISEFGDTENVTSWLDDEDVENHNGTSGLAALKQLSVIIEAPKIDVVRKSKYIVKHVDLFYALCEVDDWDFISFPDEQQEELMKALTVKVFAPGENIIVEGDAGGDLFIVSATEETADLEEVEVVNGNILAGTEVFLTKLQRGQFFGQKYFLTRRANKRGATVRVPKDSKVSSVRVAVLTPDNFEKWDSFRNLLLVKSVPMIQMLPRKERQKITQELVIREFKDGEYIIRQGDHGEDFYIIQDGSVHVTEKRPHLDHGWEEPQEHVLVTLREGHFFGEMALFTNQPRIASVISIRTTICLCLSKKDFRAALSDDTFHQAMSSIYAQRTNIRAVRSTTESSDLALSVSNSTSPSTSSSTSRRLTSAGSSPSILEKSVSARKIFKRSSNASKSLHRIKAHEVSFCSTVNMRKLESGSRVINKYVVENELGRGSYGEVYLCVDQETGSKYAMKIINRPQSSWNDENTNSVRQEIAVMKRLRHENIVNLIEVIDDPNTRKIFLIQEYMEKGALMEDSESCEPLDPGLARSYFRDILRGVCYLHSEGVIHRDIKPQNMLLSLSGTVKIADFGAAVFTGAVEKDNYGGTPAFMAPELFLTHTNIDFTKMSGIDIFALGATLYYMICGRPPWMGRNVMDLAMKIKNIELTFPSNIIDPHLKHLLRQMLTKDYRTRITLDAIVVDEWVTSEGSELLFESGDYCGTDYGEFREVMNLAPDGSPPPQILILDYSAVKRIMLSRKISNALPVCCCCVESEEEVLAVVQSAISSGFLQNFSYVFLEVRPFSQSKSIATIMKLRKMGYTGKVVAMSHMDYSAVTGNATISIALENIIGAQLADSFFYCPISSRDIDSILISGDLFRNVGVRKTQSCNVGLTDEDMEHAIINISVPRLNSKDSIVSETTEPSRGLISTISSHNLLDYQDVPDDVNIKDFQDFHRTTSLRNISTIFEEEGSGKGLNQADAASQSQDLSRLTFRRGQLLRKRNFTIVPYSSSHDLHQAARSPRSSDGPDFHIITNMSDRKEYRRAKRESAMNRSLQAHEDRKNNSSALEADPSAESSIVRSISRFKAKVSFSSSKATNSSKKRLPSRHTLDSLPDSMYSLPSPPPPSTGLLPVEALEQRSLAGSSLATGIGRTDESSPRNTETASSFYGNDIHSGESMYENIQYGDSTSSSSSSSEDDSYDREEIQDLSGDALNDMFDDLIQKAATNKNTDTEEDLREWNHVIARPLKVQFIAAVEDTSLQLEIKSGKGEAQGICPYMEDRLYSNVNQCQCAHPPTVASSNAEDTSSPLGLFGVFDGHNGFSVAEILQKDFAHDFEALFRRLESKEVNFDQRMHHLFEEAILAIDLKILQSDYLLQQQAQQLKSAFAGSCGVIMAVVPARRKSITGKIKKSSVQVFIAHIGDCRAVLSNDGVAMSLTEDHKPNLKSEKLRIEAAGGWVQNGRVNGNLGVSRSVGDIQFKVFSETPGMCSGKEDVKGSLWSSCQQVISKPDVMHFTVEEHHEFVVLASDGLWDVFPPQECVNFVRKQLFKTKNIDKTATELIQKALKRGSQDNVSVVIVAFHQAEYC